MLINPQDARAGPARKLKHPSLDVVLVPALNGGTAAVCAGIAVADGAGAVGAPPAGVATAGVLATGGGKNVGFWPL